MVPVKEQQRAAQPAVAQPVQPPAPPAGKPAVAAPTLPAPAAPQQPSKSAAPLPVMPAAGQPQVQRPGSFAAAAAGGKPAATAAVPVVVPPQAGMPPVTMQQGGPVRQQHGAGPRGGQARGPSGQQQPGVALNPALMAGSMYAQQVSGHLFCIWLGGAQQKQRLAAALLCTSVAQARCHHGRRGGVTG